MDLNHLFPFVVGIVFVGFVALFFFMLKQMFCAYSRNQDNQTLTSTLAVETGRRIVFQPGDVLTVQHPEMASFALSQRHTLLAAVANDDTSKNIYIITTREDPSPPSYQEATKSNLQC